MLLNDGGGRAAAPAKTVLRPWAPDPAPRKSEDRRGQGPSWALAPKTEEPARPATKVGVPKFLAKPQPALPSAPPSRGVRAVLNERNWTLPKQPKAVSMPKDSFELDAVTELKPYSYELSSDEASRLKDTYSSDAAKAAGYVPPTDKPRQAADLLEHPFSTGAADLDKTLPLMKVDKLESAPVTWETYDTMSTDQRAATDFNTLLVKSREDDLSKSWMLVGDELTQYEKKVENLFGKGGGSETLAPNTVDLLSKLDMKFVGQDLDEYLSLERAIDAEEMVDFKFSKKDAKTLDTLANPVIPWKPEVVSSLDYQDVRSPENQMAIDTQAIKKAQDLIKKVMQDPATLVFDFDTAMFGPSAEMQIKGTVPVGYGAEGSNFGSDAAAANNAWYQEALAILGSKDPATEFGIPAGTNVMGMLIEDMKVNGADDNEVQDFLNFVDNRTSLVGQYGAEQDAELSRLIRERAGLGG